MFHQLISRNDDIRRLVEKGYAVAFDVNQYLVVRDVPYLDQNQALQWGAIVTKFVDVGQDKIVLDDHQVFFAGSVPYGLDGKPIPNLGGGETRLALGENSVDIVVQRSFSNKPTNTGVFKDFFEKIESYVTIISGPASELYDAKYLTFRMAEEGEGHSPFTMRDTLTSRAEIGDLAEKFKNDVIVVIGLGGTGGFVLDFLVKTPVREIRAFDGDQFHVHTAFRSPGKVEGGDIGRSKAEVYQLRYDNFRTGLTCVQKFIDATCTEDLRGATFAFVCVDKGTSRAEIFDLLISMGIPFIDVGMGLRRREGALNGMLRTTYYSAERAREVLGQGWVELTDRDEDLYRVNIQIGELNALNACLAVIRFKQIRGFYFDDIGYDHLLFHLHNLKILGHAEAEDN